MKRDILIYFDIITSLRTVNDAEYILSEIDTLMQAFFKSEKTTINSALESISAETAGKIQQIFLKQNLDIADRSAVTEFLSTMRDLIRKFKVIKLTLAFKPNNRTIENIHNFVKEELGIGYILNIEVEPETLAGAIVTFNGQYLDYSLNKAIGDAFKTKKDEITKLIQ